MQLFDLLFRSVFFGFIVWTFIWAFRKHNVIGQFKFDTIDRFAIRLIMVFGSIPLLITFIGLIGNKTPHGITIEIDSIDDIFGKYWIGQWVYPTMYFGLIQMLWINKLRQSKISRIVLALLLFAIMNFEKFVILITSLHRDFLLAEGKSLALMSLAYTALSWLIYVLIFATIVVIGINIKKKIRSD